MSIPIPAGMEQAPVTWTLGHTTGTEALRGARGLVRFEPTAVAVAYPDVTVLPATVTARVSAGVMDSVDLTVNDPELWNWRVTPELGPAWPAFHIDVPVEGVDLATAVVVPGIGPIRAVTGPPGTTAWDELTGKPATYPPATHTHTITDVDGLQAIIDRLTYHSGTRAIHEELVNGWTAESGVYIQRVGKTVSLTLTSSAVGLNGANATSGDFWEMPHGFRPPLGNYGHIGWVSTSGTRTPVSIIKSLNYLATTHRGLMQGILTWTTNDPIPTTLPGKP